MTEVSLFIIVGVIAVVSAALMLLSDNAVHSALFLIVVMGCIAFLFLMLNAAFLAMVQITVYAGAIMVLFLFVIMLLGAEKLTGGTPFRWVTPASMLLALGFLLVAALALGEGTVSSFALPAGEPRLRVAHFAPDAGLVDLVVDGEVVDEPLEFGDSVGYLTLPAGDHDIELVEVDSGETVLANSLNLAQGFVGTALVYGQGESPTFSIIDDDVSASEERSGRLTVFNADDDYPAVSLVDFGNETDQDDTVVVVDNLALGEMSEPLDVSEDFDLSTLAVIEAGNENNVLTPLRNEEVFFVERDTATLLVVAADRRFDEVTRAMAVPLITAVTPAFGSPSDVGQALFSRYMLPMQAVAILLLVAMVGAIVLTHKPKESPALARARLGRRRVSRPLTSVIASQVGQDVTQAPQGNGSPDQLPEPAEKSGGN